MAKPIRKPTDSRRAGGDIAGPGGPHDQGAFVIDTTNAVLLDGCTVVMVDPVRDGHVDDPTLAMLLEGRINKTADRAVILYLFDANGAAAIISSLMALAPRIGPEFRQLLSARVETLLREGAM